ncbi:MAG: hypothetical protein PHW34_01930 [Hespellia sp.]|nr:hypothetical protein [Hespellia sp.]
MKARRNKNVIIQIGRDLCTFTETDISYINEKTTTLEDAERRLTTARQRSAIARVNIQ